ncbi:hypothetical protein FB45DRAFT_892206 [Roridomyces roridus]|uniref:SPT23/MGA2-like DNA-binding domain-containing protein n=1 Tax=Roridomyces roridus TaxID=1738132 RepID=A0AAD7FZV1_9AGAR|nr:hypothetical protein FB45DRAFT_892206 [Roridomyces roridus]
MSSSSSTAAGSDSRSSSPHTPEPSGPLDSVTIKTDFDVGTWYNSNGTLLSPQASWPIDPILEMSQKLEEPDPVFLLDDLIQPDAYDDAPSVFDSPQSSKAEISLSPPTLSNFHPGGVVGLHHGIPTTTKPVPPPPSVSRTHVPSPNLKVVYPPKESCYNLSIMFPSLRDGAKSRVETQVRVVVDLADSSLSPDAFQYDRVGSWKWLRLPRGTATKRRTRKQGKIDPDPQDTLHLTASVTCASAPHNRVFSCTTCQTREAKRVAKKLAARVRPARSDSESGDDTKSAKGKQEDTSSIIQFNCAEVQDFSSGSVVLPLRITCYCRHHREKVGFNVHLTMMDHNGRIVANGISKPIMITDDHKTPAVKGTDLQAQTPRMDVEWSAAAEAGPAARAPSKRKKDNAASPGGKKRAKPYDVASKPSKRSREPSVVDSQPSPSSSYVDSTRSPTPNLPVAPALQPSSLESDSSGDAPATPPDFSDVAMLAVESEAPSCLSFTTAQPQAMPFVTILGANFHPSLQLDCVFGDVVAGSTHRWSDNTLVCILPPRATPGAVPVWFNNFPKVDESPLFTYSDESDRQLMELALQVVGLKMTGKIEDAKDVAMRIVGTVGSPEASDMQTDTTGANVMQARNLLLLGRNEEGFENQIIKLLSVLRTPLDLPNSAISLAKAISHPSSSGQTLLHLASFLGFESLISMHVTRTGILRCTFAAISGSNACLEVLLQAGADPEIVNALGKTPKEICTGSFPVDEEEDEEAHWGDAEEDSDDSTGPSNRRVVHRRKRSLRRTITPRASKSSLTPEPAKSDAVDKEKQAATLFAMIQRTLAQLPAPQLPGLGLPQLPEMPAVPWAALPQLPMVFPVLVPWPAFLGRDATVEPREGSDDEGKGLLGSRAAQDLRGTWEAWEKWLALALAGAAKQQQREEAPPPMYTPREEAAATTPAETASSSRPVGYNDAQSVTEQEVNAYGYVPAEPPKKHDRMLLFFWLPILMISLLWAMHNGARLALNTFRATIPLKTGLRT